MQLLTNRFVFLALSLLVSWTTSIAQQNNLKGGIHLIEGIQDYRLEIKFNTDISPYLNSSGKIDKSKVPPNKYQELQIIESLSLPYSHTLKSSSQDHSRKTLNGFERLMEVPDLTTKKSDLIGIAQKLENLSIVQYVDLVPLHIIPPPTLPTYSYEQTPDLSLQQNYLNANPGINAKHAWSLQIFGEGIRVADIEYDWDELHEDIISNFDDSFLPVYDVYKDHGTAVLGMLAGNDNNKGVVGAASKAAYRGYGEHPTGRAAAILEALEWLRPGDVMVIEMQSTVSGVDDYVPADIAKSVWDAILAATNKGVHVVAAAGNGSVNLDELNNYRERGDNGSIIVGAGNNLESHQIQSFSSYGSRVNVQGWGNPVVTTAGYGNYAIYDNNEHRKYTNSFSGTSSATAMVASAVILIQSWAKKELNLILTPSQMRDLLVSTGNPQGGSNTEKHIGPCPDVKRAINKLQGININVDTNIGLTLSEGKSKKITTDNIRTDGRPATDSDILYHMTTSPQNGFIVYENNRSQVIDSFTQQDLKDNKIYYIHDGSNTIEDIITLTISNGYAQLTDIRFNINVLPVDNDFPSLITHESLSLSEGSSATINTTVLSAIDSEAPNTAIRYLITIPPVNGIITLKTNSSQPLLSFSQQDLIDQTIVYRHDDSNTLADIFYFTLTDGTNTLEGLQFSILISPVDDDIPLLENNKALVLVENSQLITTNELLATDSDSENLFLTYLITSPPTFGSIVNINNPESSITEFKNQALINNEIMYIRKDHSGKSDTFRFTVSDGLNELTDQIFEIKFNLITDLENRIENISIYPNPASEFINIKSPHNIDKIILFDLQGRIIHEQPVQKGSLTIDIRDLAKSFYILSIVYKRQIINHKVFIGTH